MLVEIAYIQKFILFLHHPILAVATVLGAFLGTFEPPKQMESDEAKSVLQTRLEDRRKEATIDDAIRVAAVAK